MAICCDFVTAPYAVPEFLRSSYSLTTAYLKGTDLWHLASALFLAPDPKELAFLTLDARQGEIAGRIGFTL